MLRRRELEALEQPSFGVYKEAPAVLSERVGEQLGAGDTGRSEPRSPHFRSLAMTVPHCACRCSIKPRPISESRSANSSADS